MSDLIYLSYLRYKDFLFGITLLLHDVLASSWILKSIGGTNNSLLRRAAVGLGFNVKRIREKDPFWADSSMLHGFSYKLSVPTQYSHTLTLNICKICRVLDC